MGDDSLTRYEWEQLRAAEYMPVIVSPYEEPRIEYNWCDEDIPFVRKMLSTVMLTADMPDAEYDEDPEPCTDEELEDFILHP
jgi:hypothetical protein